MASYLKALGVLRVVSEQVDQAATGRWVADGFIIDSTLDGDELVEFFLTRWAPTPIVAPWNGGSGFYTSKKKSRAALERIRSSRDERLAQFATAIHRCEEIMKDLGVTEAPKDEAKATFIENLRAGLPDSCTHWIDCSVSLTAEGPKWPPLLGTGGTDGNLDFTGNFIQRVVELLLEASGHSAQNLKSCLLGQSSNGLISGIGIGQMSPRASGGTNAGPGFTSESLVNPWDFVLMLEGALFFASAATRKLERSQPGTLSFPFMVRAAAAGYGSAATAEEDGSRNELWLPLWDRPVGLHELLALFGEGRAKVGRRSAVDGIDFARAVASLGVDRGFTQFSRYGFFARNGKNHFATPLGRHRARREPGVDLLASIDPWLDAYRRACRDVHAPSAWVTSRRRVDEVILALCEGGRASATQEVLIALGEVERVLNLSAKRTAENYLRPVPPLARNWIDQGDDGSIEWRLALALASPELRTRIVRVRKNHGGVGWLDAAREDRSTVWRARDLASNLIAVLLRREVEAERRASTDDRRAHARASLDDVVSFIGARTDDARIEALVRGLVLIDAAQLNASPSLAGRRTSASSASHRAVQAVPLLFAVMSPVHHRRLGPDLELPRTAGMLSRGASGDAAAASRLAARRLRGAGFDPVTQVIHEDRRITRRCVAAMAFEISASDRARMLARAIVPKASDHDGGAIAPVAEVEEESEA